MNALLALFGIAKASAASIEQIGSGSPGIDNMWAGLKQIFPHTDLGSGGLTFLILVVINIILRLIAGGAALMVVYAGIRLIMTVAEEGAHTEAKKILLYAGLGLILAIGADAIVAYVITLVEAGAGG